MDGQPHSRTNADARNGRHRVLANVDLADAEADADAAADVDIGEIRRRDDRPAMAAVQARVVDADERDLAAHARELRAVQRDARADERERELASRLTGEHDGGLRAVTGAETVVRAGDRRARAERYRTDLAQLLALAAEDRRAAAADREHAARDRLRARADREALVRQLAVAETDALTGARTRAPGLRDLDLELERARRTEATLVVAYVDVAGLKRVNDTEGHRAGDALLTRVVTQIRTRLRPYDLIIRLGGDEFLCALSSTTLVEARERFSEISAALASSPQHTTIRVGFTELAPDDTIGDLIARADRELLELHHRRHDRRNGGRPANRHNGDR